MSQKLYDLLSRHLSSHKLELFKKVAEQRTRYVTLVFEDIYQAQNSSAILRSAETWGVQDIHIIENNHSFQQHQRISKGAADWLTLLRYNQAESNTSSCLQTLKSKGYRVAVTAFGDDCLPPSSIPLDQPIAVLMGTELTGASDAAMKNADVKLQIPGWGFTKSLNVAAAAAVICQRLSERIREENIHWQLSQEEQLALKIEWAKQSIKWSKYLLEMFESNEI
jgi:tRNA (guanosine-2'-O-)-methyltransferase